MIGPYGNKESNLPDPFQPPLARVMTARQQRPLQSLNMLLLWLGAAALAGAVAAIRLGSDADYDMRKYHVYNGFALIQGRITSDIDPAKLQTYFAPGLDLIYDGLVALLNHHPVLLSAALALPQGFAWFLTWRLTSRMLPDETPTRRWLAAALTLIGATGAAGISTLSLAMSEMTAISCILLAILLATAAPNTGWRTLGSGLLAGLGLGFKLTMAPYVAGLGIAIMLAAGRRHVLDSIRFSIGGLLGAMMTGGWWWIWLWIRFRNPFFPMFNQIFRSPWIAPVAWTDVRYLPKTWIHAIDYPLIWALQPKGGLYVGEHPMRDPRVVIGGLAVAVCVGRLLWQRRYPDRKSLILLLTWALGYILWEVRFSIYRYAGTLELLVPPLLAGALAPLLARWRSRRSIPIILATAIALTAWTVYPEWGHTGPGPVAISVHPPDFAPGSLVLLLDNSPIAYVAAFEPASVRFVGTNNNLIDPRSPGRLEQLIRDTIRDQRGPIWGLEEDPATANRTLAAYNLVRGPGCVPVPSNLEVIPIRACPLIRTSAPPPRQTAPSPPAPARAASVPR